MTSQMRDSRGFSLLELLVAMFVMTVVLGLSVRALTNAMHADEAIGLMADANQSLQSAQTMMVRDLIDAGRNLDLGGLPIPGGGLTVARPGPANAVAAGWPTATILYAVTPGNELGPDLNGNPTDVVTIVSVDDTLQPQLNATITVTDTGATVTMAEEDGVGDTPRHSPRVGDLMWVSRGGQRAVLHVTRIDEGNSRIFYAETDGDTTNFNQQDATTGSMVQLGSSPPDPDNAAIQVADTKVSRLKMTTYWVEEADGVPFLMRQDNYRAPMQVGLGVDNLELQYDVFLGGAITRVDNYTEVALATPSNFDKAHVNLAVRSDKRFGQTKTFLRNNLTTQVSFRSLQVKLNFQ